jgi:MSHA biogenesis protein MshQ
MAAPSTAAAWPVHQYTCAMQMADTDAVVIASGYGVTVNSDVTIGYNRA